MAGGLFADLGLIEEAVWNADWSTLSDALALSEGDATEWSIDGDSDADTDADTSLAGVRLTHTCTCGGAALAAS